jgi:hypothetical protein
MISYGRHLNLFLICISFSLIPNLNSDLRPPRPQTLFPILYPVHEHEPGTNANTSYSRFPSPVLGSSGLEKVFRAVHLPRDTNSPKLRYTTTQRNTQPALDTEPNFPIVHHLIILRSYHAAMSMESSPLIPYYFVQFY